MLAGILLLREPQSIRAELLEKTRRIRADAKEQIGTGVMTLDGLTEEQISFISDRAPNLRQGFRKILKLVGHCQVFQSIHAWIIYRAPLGPN